MTRRQRGITLVESLVAFAVASLGTVSVLRLQRDLRFDGQLATQRVQAGRLGQSSLERQRADAGLLPPVESTIDNVPAPATQFTVSTSVEAPGTPASAAATRAQASVAWPDARGKLRLLGFDTVVTRDSPTLAAALSLRPVDGPPARIAGRSPLVPADAVDIGAGHSAWRQQGVTDHPVWIVDNTSGNVVARCEDMPAAGAALDRDACPAAHATVLSGIVRTSLAAPPDAVGADDPPESIRVALVLSVPKNAAAPTCSTDVQSVPDARLVAYHCVVATPAGGWSGRTSLTSAPARRVCRYVPAADDALSADPNARHPTEYVAVTRSLPQQNFLLVRGDQPCPPSTEPQQP